MDLDFTNTMIERYKTFDQEKKDMYLFFAISLDFLEEARTFINTDASVEARNKYDQTPLMCAAINGNVGICELLLRRGANVDATTKNGDTALILAAKYGQSDVVNLLIRYFADIDVVNADKHTALSIADAYEKKTTAFQILLAMTTEKINSALFSYPNLNQVVNSYSKQVAYEQKKIFSIFWPQILKGNKTNNLENDFPNLEKHHEVLAMQLKLHFPLWYRPRLAHDLKYVGSVIRKWDEAEFLSHFSKLSINPKEEVVEKEEKPEKPEKKSKKYLPRFSAENREKRKSDIQHSRSLNEIYEAMVGKKTKRPHSCTITK